MLNLKNKHISFDTEATGLNPYGDFKRWGFYPARPFAFSFCDLEGNTHFIRWEVDPFTRRVIANKKDLPFLRDVLEDERITKIGHNIGYDVRMMEKTGIQVNGKLHDTLVMMHVVTGGSELQYGLKPITKKYLEFSDEDESDLQEDTVRARRKGKQLGWCLASKETHGKEPVKADYWMANKKLLESYAVKDAERASMLFLLCKDKIETSENLYSIYEKEMKLFHVVRKMENVGVRVYPDQIDDLEKFYQKYMAKQKAVADKNGGKGLNYKSPKQMVEVFINKKKIKPTQFTDKGTPSINGDFLVSIQDKEPLAKAILEYKGASHGITAFLNPYRNFMVQEGGVWVLHPNYKQCGPVTGRFSCSDPNLMQVASETSGRKRTEISLHPRRCFGPRPGHVWYAPDYSQIEVWIFAFQAKEKAMMEALLAGHDFHGAVAKKAWGHLPDYEVNKSYYRKRAKLILFCKIYGGGKGKIAYLLDCSIAEAAKFIQEFEEQLPGVTVYMDKMVSQARRDGVIQNAFGREYHIDPNFCYKATNYMIQGTAADVMKGSMIHLDAMLSRRWPGVRMLLTLHDELIVETPMKFHSRRLMREIMSEMQRESKRAGVPVPLPVSMKMMTSKWSEEIKLCDKHLIVDCKAEICNKK